jgi:hypothetical protein
MFEDIFACYIQVYFFIQHLLRYIFLGQQQAEGIL